METASRGLAFFSYQVAQEVVYQEHLAKGLTEKYSTLSQQMDQLIHDGNTQIKALHEKLQALQAEQAELEEKNHELAEALKEKARAHAQSVKMYQSLKAQVMASQVADAASHEAEHSLHTARKDRGIDRLPGTRVGSAANFGSSHAGQHASGGRSHRRDISRSSGNGPQQIGISIGPSFPGDHLRSHVHSGFAGTSETPSQVHRSRLPVLGGARQHTTHHHHHDDKGSSYQASPMTRQTLAGPSNIGNNLGNFSFGSKALRIPGIGGKLGTLDR